MVNNYIFTFWEPKEKMPAYLKLCMKTWKKYLPDYEIIQLNFDNLSEYLPDDIVKRIIYKKIPLAQQADCIRAWLLHLHGGFWFDSDTILTDDKVIRELNKYRCSMLGDEITRNKINIGFIYSQKTSSIIKQWAEEIPNRVSSYKKSKHFKLFYKIFNNKGYNAKKHFGYFGNNILDPLIKEANNEEFFILDKNKINSLLEQELVAETNPVIRYRKFYFENLDYKKALSKNKGIICLHNSWTPQEYKDMDEKEFLDSNCTLANLLVDILKNK